MAEPETDLRDRDAPQNSQTEEQTEAKFSSQIQSALVKTTRASRRRATRALNMAPHGTHGDISTKGARGDMAQGSGGAALLGTNGGQQLWQKIITTSGFM